MKTLAAAMAFIAILMAGPARADEPLTPEDFAFGLVVEPAGGGPVLSVELPLDFYRGVTRNDLGDVALFNGRGERVAFALDLPAAQPSHPSWADLPVFPVYGEGSQRADNVSLQIRRDASGAIIDVNAGEPGAPDRKIVAYLVDAGDREQPLEAIDLHWQPSVESFVGKVTVESSDDLDHWTTRVKDATIAGLQYASHSLLQRRIRLGGVKARYWRLSWPESREGAALTGVTAELREEAVLPPLEWTSVQGTINEEKGSGAGADSKAGTTTGVAYDLSGPLPVTRVRIRLPEENTLLSASLFSRASRKASWRARHTGTVYRLSVKGQELFSSDVELSPPVLERYWLLKMAPEDGADLGSGQGRATGEGEGRGLPVLEMGWIHHRLVFIPRGQGPFRLAFGSGRLSEKDLHRDASLVRFMAENKGKVQMGTARLGSRIVLGGESKLTPRVVYPWKQWILWAVLILGVALMAWMAVRLYRQMSGGNAGEGE